MPDLDNMIADLFYPISKDPLAKRELMLKIYPNKAENHHKARAIYVQYSPEGAGLWTTYLGLASALIQADMIARELSEK